VLVYCSQYSFCLVYAFVLLSDRFPIFVSTGLDMPLIDCIPQKLLHADIFFRCFGLCKVMHFLFDKESV